MIDIILDALRTMRPPFALHEMDIHKMVESRLGDTGIAFVHEAVIGKGCRIDYLAGNVGIEIKKGKPLPAELLRQLTRYTACEMVAALIVITQRNVKIPETLAGKPVRLVVLPQLWGVALP